MGCFSWITQDTNKPILIGEKKKIIMTDDKGNQFVEECYEGYGEFGGKDYYELLAEMNGYGPDRDRAIEVAYGEMRDDEGNMSCMYPHGDNPNIKYPSLSESGEYFDGRPPKSDPEQGS